MYTQKCLDSLYKRCSYNNEEKNAETGDERMVSKLSHITLTFKTWEHHPCEV